jgi:hypothetical protein
MNSKVPTRPRSEWYNLKAQIQGNRRGLEYKGGHPKSASTSFMMKAATKWHVIVFLDHRMIEIVDLEER